VPHILARRDIRTPLRRRLYDRRQRYCVTSTLSLLNVNTAIARRALQRGSPS
jgi:hypothetical protein